MRQYLNGKFYSEIPFSVGPDSHVVVEIRGTSPTGVVTVCANKACAEEISSRNFFNGYGLNYAVRKYDEFVARLSR